MFALPQLTQKFRAQDRGHQYAERALINLGARPPRAGQHPADWLTQALADVGARKVRHPGNHRFIEPRSVSHGYEVIR